MWKYHPNVQPWSPPARLCPWRCGDFAHAAVYHGERLAAFKNWCIPASRIRVTAIWQVCSELYSSIIATARVHPADAFFIFTGKQTMWKPFAGRDSRLCSFSRWQYPISRPALCPSQIISGSCVSENFWAVYRKGASQDQASVPVTCTPCFNRYRVASRPIPRRQVGLPVLIQGKKCRPVRLSFCDLYT